MVTIRLARGGSKKRPFYHLTVTNSRNARDGRFVERIGFFNPVATGGEVRLSVDRERATYWLGQGAQPSERVAQLLKDAAKANA
ncbi:30S ribosomal protein S16 [Pseudomonas aeruginosa]|uniref:30S ribosomal protein S16 n=1 Tax=Pseudomonas aeruginosa TaxID=287 RepID=UPI0007750F7B|nr:30S ribosomal protein S16 [Pseudomonas aeruginosa]KXE81606.1 30S ribosomal protein S16 [Pseudomonas aeruginosa]